MASTPVASLTRLPFRVRMTGDLEGQDGGHGSISTASPMSGAHAGGRTRRWWRRGAQSRSARRARRPAAAGPRRRHTAAPGRRACCSHRASGSARAARPSACATSGSRRWWPAGGAGGPGVSHGDTQPSPPGRGAGTPGAHRLDGLVALPDDLLDLPQHRHLGVLQFLLLRLGVGHTRPVGGHGFLCLAGVRGHTEPSAGFGPRAPPGPPREPGRGEGREACPRMRLCRCRDLPSAAPARPRSPCS